MHKTWYCWFRIILSYPWFKIRDQVTWNIEVIKRHQEGRKDKTKKCWYTDFIAITSRADYSGWIGDTPEFQKKVKKITWYSGRNGATFPVRKLNHRVSRYNRCYDKTTFTRLYIRNLIQLPEHWIILEQIGPEPSFRVQYHRWIQSWNWSGRTGIAAVKRNSYADPGAFFFTDNRNQEPVSGRQIRNHFFRIPIWDNKRQYETIIRRGRRFRFLLWKMNGSAR